MLYHWATGTGTDSTQRLKASAFIYDHRHIKTWINQLISLQCKVCRLPLTVLHILNLTTRVSGRNKILNLDCSTHFNHWLPLLHTAPLINCHLRNYGVTMQSHAFMTSFECVLHLYILYTVTLVIGSPELDLNTRCKNEVYAWYLGTFYQLLVCYINKAMLFSQDKTFLVFMQQPDWVFQHCNSQRPRLK